jgi:hypothetical protein
MSTQGIRKFEVQCTYSFYILADTSETYWKLMTEHRRQAIKETNIENQQVNSMNLLGNLFAFLVC